MEEPLVLLAALLATLLMGSGAALMMFFWARKLSAGLRSLIATVIIATVLLLFTIDGLSSGEGFVVLIGLAAISGVVVFPVAYLCSRKLERQAGASIATFE